MDRTVMVMIFHGKKVLPSLFQTISSLCRLRDEHDALSASIRAKIIQRRHNRPELLISCAAQSAHEINDQADKQNQAKSAAANHRPAEIEAAAAE